MRKETRKLITFGVVISMFASIPMVSNAAQKAAWTWRGKTMNSYGSIDYTKEGSTTPNIHIDAADFETLTSEIDTLENTYKQGIADSLNQLDKGNVITDVAAKDGDVYVPFSDLQTAIVNSQKIPDGLGTVHVDTNGSILESGGTEKTITAATADNLSAGTAAWVDGELIQGTGADNNSYYNIDRIKYWSFAIQCSKGATNANIKDYCEKWDEISSSNGYILNAYVNQVYCRNADSYASCDTSYNMNTGYISWDMTMNAAPYLRCVIIYDPDKDSRL